MMPGTSNLLTALARRVRGRRGEFGWSRSELARRSGLSERFLARVESGDGNISVMKLAGLAQALETRADRLIRPASATRAVALVGLRGAGKSTVGPLLSSRLDRPFIEMDELITEESGLSLTELFELHGEPYYRRIELRVLQRVLDRPGPVVLATAGGVVNEPASWELLHREATVVWLRADPESHWSRVVAQGDRRPMADNPAAMEQLRELHASRAEVYAQAAISIDTTGGQADWVADRIVEELANAG